MLHISESFAIVLMLFYVFFMVYKYLFPCFLLTFVFIFSGCSIGLSGDEALSSQEQLCINSGGDFLDDSCACPKLFPVYNEETLLCQNAAGQPPLSRKHAHRLDERLTYVFACRARLHEVYVVPGTQITFCYDKEWGSPQVTSESIEDISFKITSFTSEDTDRTRSVPRLIYTKVPDVLNIDGICLSCVDDLSVSEEDISIDLNLSSEDFFEVVDVAGVSALRITYVTKGFIIYYLPHTFDGYSIRVSSDIDYGPELDTFMEGLWFDDLVI